MIRPRRFRRPRSSTSRCDAGVARRTVSLPALLASGLALLVHLGVTGPAAAQYDSGGDADSSYATPTPPGITGPAGNTHPEARVEAAPEEINPMLPGGIPDTPVVDRRTKHAFARAVDLSPLGSLAVFTNSRVSILDAVARDTVRTLTGKGHYADFAITRTEEGGLDIEKLAYDPLFTFFDLVGDPRYYLQKPLIHVELLGFRRAILEEALPGPENTEERERWMKLTRISPHMFIVQQERIRDEFGADSTYTRSVGKLNRAMNLFAGAYTRLDLVPAATPDQPWRHASAVPEVAGLFGQMGQAWQARDAERVNELARRIAEVVPTLEPEAYPPDWRRDLEGFYAGGRKFVIGYVLYFAALVALLVAFGTGRRSMTRLGVALLFGGLAVHAAGFAVRWILAERIPIQNQFESMLGLCLGACVFGTAAMFVRRQTIFGAAAAGVGFLTLMTATMTDIPGREIQREAAILNTSYILFYHVNIVLFSYGLIALGAIVSLVYLAVHHLGGDRGALRLAAAGINPIDAAGTGKGVTDNADAASPESGATARRRLLADLDHAQMVILQLAFWILGVGILLGAWWADHSWGRWWAFDPKETWALITWIVYLIVIHVRLTTRNRGLVTAWLSIVGFFVMLWTYFGVNLLLPGLHAYA